MTGLPSGNGAPVKCDGWKWPGTRKFVLAVEPWSGNTPVRKIRTLDDPREPDTSPETEAAE